MWYALWRVKRSSSITLKKNSRSTRKDRNVQKSLVTKPVSRRSQVFWYFENVNDDSDFITGWEVSDQLTHCKRPKKTVHRSSTFEEKYCIFDLRNLMTKHRIIIRKCIWPLSKDPAINKFCASEVWKAMRPLCLNLDWSFFKSSKGLFIKSTWIQVYIAR